jgi:hypothetical protein
MSFFPPSGAIRSTSAFPVDQLKEPHMGPQEIIDRIDEQNRQLLYSRNDFNQLSHEQILHLMNTAAMRGFRFGSDSALSLVQSKLVVKYFTETTSA